VRKSRRLRSSSSALAAGLIDDADAEITRGAAAGAAARAGLTAATAAALRLAGSVEERVACIVIGEGESKNEGKERGRKK